MTQTNAQAALQAAATVYGMTEGDVNPGDITGMAYQFKRWLDRKDKEELPAPDPEVSHKVYCAKQYSNGNDCSCTPVAYTVPADAGLCTVPKPSPRPGPKHFLSENHNADPVCHCGWNPVEDLMDGAVPSREAARNAIRCHIANLK